LLPDKAAELIDVEFYGALTGVKPILSPSQLPLLALAFGRQLLDWTGKLTVACGGFFELAKQLSAGQPGIILTGDMVYVIEIVCRKPADKMTLAVEFPYLTSHVLPKGVKMQQALTDEVFTQKNLGMPPPVLATPGIAALALLPSKSVHIQGLAARAMLGTANLMREEGDNDGAAELYDEVIKTFPGTEWAEKAREGKAKCQGR